MSPAAGVDPLEGGLPAALVFVMINRPSRLSRTPISCRRRPSRPDLLASPKPRPGRCSRSTSTRRPASCSAPARWPPRRAGPRAGRHARPARHRPRPGGGRPPAAGRGSRCAGAGLEVFVFDGVEENPTTRHVEAGVALRPAASASTSSSPSAAAARWTAPRASTSCSPTAAQMADYKGFGKATKPMLPSIGVPTTAGTGSEAQSYALIADEKIAPEDGLRRPQGGVPRRHPRPGSDRVAAAPR